MTNDNRELVDLIEAVSTLRYDGLNPPCSDELRLAWPDLGRAWIVAWATELARDVAIIDGEISAAGACTDPRDARTPLENALWRLDSAREKLHTTIALIFGIESLAIGTDKRQTLSFMPSDDATRAMLKRLEHPAAEQLLTSDATLKGTLLLRHQVAHSLAPVVDSVSLTWFEVGFIRAGSVHSYEAKHLPPKGLKQLKDIGTDALLKRSLRLAQTGSRSLKRAASALAVLTNDLGTLHPPPVIWYATELERSFATRGEASSLSRAAAGLPPSPFHHGHPSE